MISFSVPDLLIAIVLAVFVIRSSLRGFLREIFSLAAIGIAAFAAAGYGDSAALLASGWLGGAGWLDSAAGPAVFAAVWIVLASVSRAALRFLATDSPGLSSKLGGGLVGCLKGVFVVGLALAGLEAYAPGYAPEGGKSDAILPYVREVSARIKGLAQVDVPESLDLVKEKAGEASDGAAAVKERVTDSASRLPGVEEKLKEGER